MENTNDLTVKKIAELAKVSRGTVDRVLHNRGRVKPETEAAVKEVIEKLGYQVNPLGRALVMTKKKYKIGVMISLRERDFLDQVLEGVKDGKIYAEQYGLEVMVSTPDRDDYDDYLQALKMFEERGVSGIAMTGTSNGLIRDKVLELHKNGVKVITLNRDMDRIYRDSYVGQDHSKSGRCAAYLLSSVCGKGRVLIIGVREDHRASAERIGSFKDYLKKEASSLTAEDICYCQGDNDLSYKIAQKFFKDHPDTVGAFVSGAGLSGCCNAIKDLGLVGKIHAIGFDPTETNVNCLKQGTAQFLIDQNPYQQGYLPIKILADSIFNDSSIENDFNDTGIGIITKYNL